jgi:hypothetical protein
MVAKVIILVIAATTVACSDNTQLDLARCKREAVKVYHLPVDEREWKREPLVHLSECMTESGYRLIIEERDCIKVGAAVLPSCWRSR